MTSIIGIILIVAAIVAFFKVTAMAMRVGLGLLLLVGVLLIVVPLMTGGGTGV